MQKRCFKCLRIKPLRLFYKHKQMGDGHLNKCKKCTKNDVKKRYRDPISHLRIVAYERERFKDPRRKANVARYQRKMRKTHPRKYRANQKISYAVKHRQILKQPCMVCKNPKAQAHHPDYRKPLYIKWLCFKHHRMEHNQLIA